MTLTDKVRQEIKASKKQVFLRHDFDGLGDYRQISRALVNLQKEDLILRAGHGVYAKPTIANKPEAFVQKLTKRLGNRPKRTLRLGLTRVYFGYFGNEIRIERVQQRLDRIKLMMAKYVLDHHPIAEIRKTSLETLSRWKNQGTWNSGYSEWENLLKHGSDDEIREVMTSLKEEPCNRLRQSPPYVSFLGDKVMERLRETK
jgi:hypothetical protein